MFAARRKDRGLDLEAVEMATRTSMHKSGAAVLSGLLSMPVNAPATIPCSCGATARYHDRRVKHLLTAVGRFEFERAYYVCPACHEGQSPQDRQLDVDGTSYSPAVRRMMAVVGSECSFDQSREQLALLAGVEVTTKAVERQAESIGGDIAAREQTQISRAKQLELPEVSAPAVPKLYIEMDGTGVPVVKAETENRAGKQEDQPAHTREVKLGCVFTQTKTDEEGRAVRDEDSTTYVGTIESAESFGFRIFTEAWRRGWCRAQKKIIIGDGAVWIWNLANQHFPGAIQIVDLYHARQHLWDLAAQLFPSDQAGRKRWLARVLKQLDKGKVEAVVKALRRHPCSGELAKVVANEADYFERNADKMRYPKFRDQGLFVGSGVIEAACKTIIGSRLKRSGMFWTLQGANAIIALRCTRLSGRFEDYWESRRAA